MNRTQRRALAARKDPQTLVQLADALKSSGQIGKAERKYREAIALDGRCYQAHNNLGNILQEAGRISEATEHFAVAFQINPKDPIVAFNFAFGLSAKKDFVAAVPLYRTSIALKPSYADAHSGLGSALIQLAEHEAAQHHYLEALNINPFHLEARLNLGLALVDQGKVVEALEQAQILARAETTTGFPHKAFGILLARAGCPDGAKLCFANHLAQHPSDRDEIAVLLAAVGGMLPSRATDQQIADLYASRAGGWDKGASGSMAYQGHRLIVDALAALDALHADIVVDAGCGTGLVGELLRDKSRHLVGVDLSESMLSEARRKNIYDELYRCDLIDHLTDRPGDCDTVVSAATLIHFGELDLVFQAAARSLRKGGLFVFTVFPNDEDPEAVAIGTLDGFAQGGCFRHGARYISRLAEKHGFDVALMRHDVHEYLRKSPIAGLIVALRLSDPSQG